MFGTHTDVPVRITQRKRPVLPMSPKKGWSGSSGTQHDVMLSSLSNLGTLFAQYLSPPIPALLSRL